MTNFGDQKSRKWLRRAKRENPGAVTVLTGCYPQAFPEEAAEIKKVKGSSVAGDADCLLFPNIESGNVFFKASTHMGGGEIAAMVMGTKVPCVLTSRGDSSLTKLYSIALACLAAK